MTDTIIILYCFITKRSVEAMSEQSNSKTMRVMTILYVGVNVYLKILKKIQKQKN